MKRLILLLLVLVLAPGTASAHPQLASSRPAAGEAVPGPLTELLMSFTERIELRYTSVILISTAGDTISGLNEADGTAGSAVRVRLEDPVPAGTYRLEWRTAGADGHVVGGELSFVVIDEAGGSLLDARDTSLAVHHVGSVADRQDANLRPAAVVIRWLHLLLVVLLGGGVVFPLLLDSKSSDTASFLDRCRRAASRLSALLAALALLLGIARLVMQSRLLHGPEGTWDPNLLVSLLGETTWGNAWILQMLGFALITIGASLTLELRRVGDGLSGVGLAAVSIGIALGGHAAAVDSIPLLPLVADGMHVLSAGAWIGTLAFVLVVALPLAMRHGANDRLADIVRGFSRIALVAAPTVVLTGGVSALFHVGQLRDLWATAYGQFLLGKVALVTLTGLVGVYNWRWVQPALGRLEGSMRMRRSATIEMAIAVAVLAVTAVLVATPTPGR